MGNGHLAGRQPYSRLLGAGIAVHQTLDRAARGHGGGRKRQIRRVAAALGHPVIRIMRTHIGQLGLGTLRKGAWYQLDEDEIGFMLQPAPALADIRRKRRERKRRKQAR